jgi:hypothetical protein
MNEIILTVIAGLPYTLVVLLLTHCVIGSAIALALSFDKGHKWQILFLMAIPLFSFIISVSYMFGSIL